VKQAHPGKRIRVLFHDEARLGQQGTLTRVWAERGTRPVVERQNGRTSVWVFGAVEPLTGRSVSMVASTANTFSMQEFLNGVSRELVRRDHAVLVLDGAGWHRSRELRWPRNITPLFLPPYSPELNPIERLWLYMRQRHWSNRSYAGVGDLVVAAVEDLGKLEQRSIRSICRTSWLTRELLV
jgi:transposase